MAVSFLWNKPTEPSGGPRRLRETGATPPGAVRWTPLVGQFGGFAKLGPGSCQAANFVVSSPPAPIAAYASSGVRPSSTECGRRVL